MNKSIVMECSVGSFILLLSQSYPSFLNIVQYIVSGVARILVRGHGDDTIVGGPGACPPEIF